MKPFNFIAGKPAAAIAVALLAGAGLSACGGSDDHEPPAPPPPPVPVVVIDPFYAAVAGQVSIPSETAEPISIDAIAATAPEADEPVPQS